MFIFPMHVSMYGGMFYPCNHLIFIFIPLFLRFDSTGSYHLVARCTIIQAITRQ
jgi:hypothetical protein